MKEDETPTKEQTEGRYIVADFAWTDRNNIPPGWVPFAYDISDSSIICRKLLGA